MDDASFNNLVDEVFYDLEDRVDELDLDIDIDSSGGILTFTLPDGSNVILSRQIGSYEIWVAAKSGGFHLHNENENWLCSATGEPLSTLINRVFTEQAAATVY